MAMRKRAWTQSDPGRWYIAVDHYHTARVTLLPPNTCPSGKRVYGVTYGVHEIAIAYTLNGAKSAALDYAIQERWM